MQNLLKFRQRMKLTQEELAVKLGVANASAISGIEKDKRNLTKPQIEKLLKMGATLTEVFGDDFGYSKNAPHNQDMQKVWAKIDELENKLDGKA